MAPDLRVKVAVRPPRHGGGASDSEEAVDSDEEWFDSSAESSGTGSSTTKQRRSDASDSLQTILSGGQPVMVAPPLEKKEFNSWGALDAYLKVYSAEAYQSFRARTNNKVVTRNKKIRDSRSTKPLVPEEWTHYSKTFVCTHAGKYKPRGQGKRKRQESRALECDAQVCDAQSGSVGLSWAQFELVKAGAKKKRILQFIHENSSCYPTSQDVHTLVRKLKKQTHTAQTSAKRLKQWMTEFRQELGNVGGIFVDSIHDKTKHMRELFDHFPEVVMIDATHGTNLSNEHLSGLGMVEYRAAMKALRDVATLFKHGEYSTIPKVAGGLELEDGLGDAEMNTTGGATGGVSHQTRDSEVVTEAMGVVQVIPSRQEDTMSQSVASASYVESTQVCPDQSGSIGSETGTDGGEVVSVGNETGATGGELVSDENKTGTHGDELAGSFDLGAVVGTGWVSDGHNWVRVGAGLVS
ncbi:hypothetical protein PInf_025743 [Phytophthora infestans]|nr:hypothetical protein PInf_025743 [Phytophthora infestans]